MNLSNSRDSALQTSIRQAIQRSVTALPWYVQSGIQGIFTGIVVAQGGMGALWLLKLLPFLDYAALSRTKYLCGAFALKEQALKISPTKRPEYDKEISWRSSLRPIASVAINALLATATAPLVAPYSPFSQPTRNFFHQTIAQPSTYSTLNSLEKSASFLLDPSQAFWLRKSEVSMISLKQDTLKNVKEQLAHDTRLVNDAHYVTTTSLNDLTYERILDTVGTLQSDPRYKIVLTQEKQELVNAVKPKAQEYANEVARKKKAEEARQAALVAAEKARWGLYYQNSELKDSAIQACKNAAFEKTGQSKHWLFDDRGLDFNIAPVGGQIWVGGPFKVEIARGNIDGSKRAVQVGVDCYFDKNSPTANGTIQVDW